MEEALNFQPKSYDTYEHFGIVQEFDLIYSQTTAQSYGVE